MFCCRIYQRYHRFWHADDNFRFFSSYFTALSGAGSFNFTNPCYKYLPGSLFGRTELVASVKEFKFFLLSCLLGLFVGAKLFVAANLNSLVGGIGLVVVVLSFVQLIKIKGPKRNNSMRLSSVFGVITGLLGGGTGIWGPTTVLYLTSIATPKQHQILVQGLTFAFSSVFLLLAHLYTGIFNYNTGLLSAFMTLPAMIGMLFGVGIQKYLNQEKFRLITLISLCVGGIYLMFRSLYLF